MILKIQENFTDALDVTESLDEGEEKIYIYKAQISQVQIELCRREII